MDGLSDMEYGILEAFKRAEDDVDEHVRNYTKSLTVEGMGGGWFDMNLASLHEPVDLAHCRTFYASPRSLGEIERPVDTPRNHPLRAIGRIWNDAPP